MLLPFLNTFTIIRTSISYHKLFSFQFQVPMNMPSPERNYFQMTKFKAFLMFFFFFEYFNNGTRLQIKELINWKNYEIIYQKIVCGLFKIMTKQRQVRIYESHADICYSFAATAVHILHSILKLIILVSYFKWIKKSRLKWKWNCLNFHNILSKSFIWHF